MTDTPYTRAVKKLLQEVSKDVLDDLKPADKREIIELAVSTYSDTINDTLAGFLALARLEVFDDEED